LAARIFLATFPPPEDKGPMLPRNSTVSALVFVLSTSFFVASLSLATAPTKNGGKAAQPSPVQGQGQAQAQSQGQVLSKASGPTPSPTPNPTPAVKLAAPKQKSKASAPAPSPAPSLKFTKVRLVVEAPDESQSVSLVPVDPVEVRPKPVAAVVLPVSSRIQFSSVKEAKAGNGSPGLALAPAVSGVSPNATTPASASASASASAQAQAPAPAVGEAGDPAKPQDAVESQPMLVVSQVQGLGQEDSGSGAVMGGQSFSPFFPPPPGSLPSTLEGGQALVPTPSAPSAASGSDLPRIERAIPVQQSGAGSGAPAPAASSLGLPQVPYFTDSEANAILGMVSASGNLGSEQGAAASKQAVVGQTW
jgi:hypothetical protein